MRPAARSRLRAAAWAAWVAWAVCSVAYTAFLLAWHETSVLGCAEEPAGSSNYGDASWQWWYPGQRCTYDATTVPGYGSVRAHVEHPGPLSGVVAIVLLGWLLVLVAAMIRRHHRGTSVAGGRSLDDRTRS